MTAIAIVLGAVLAVWGITIIEKRRKAGTLTYPLWQCNPMLPWSVIFAVCAVFMGSANLPRFIGLVRHAAVVQGEVLSLDPKEHCTIVYRYRVADKDYTDKDSQCGVKPGDRRDVHYDTASPESSTLYPPAIALRKRTDRHRADMPVPADAARGMA